MSILGETWAIVGNNEFATTIGIPDDPSVSVFVVAGKSIGSFQYGPGLHLDAYERAKLASCAPEMARILLELMADADDCVICHKDKYRESSNDSWSEDHYDGCEWFSLMKKAGLR